MQQEGGSKIIKKWTNKPVQKSMPEGTVCTHTIPPALYLSLLKSYHFYPHTNGRDELFFTASVPGFSFKSNEFGLERQHGGYTTDFHVKGFEVFG